MDAFIPRTPTVQSWLQDGSLARCEVAYESWLNERGYTASTARNYLGCLVRFASWATNQRLMPEDLSLGLIRCFVDEHLRHCDCPYRVQRSRAQVRAALAQLLPALGAAGIAYVTETPNAEERELNRFDAYLREQRGLSANPRLQRCKILTGLLMLSPQKNGQPAWQNATRLRRYTSACGGGVLPVLASPAVSRLAGLPQTLTSDEVERVLNSFDAS
jgi:hypothetical protein